MRNFIFSFLALILLPAYMSGQAVSGKVLDENGLPLPGVTVSVVSSGAGTASDFDGNFSLSVAEGEPLLFSYIGYTDIKVNASEGMSVRMQPSSTDLTEVVVIGYGTARKRDLTGSIVKVDGSEVADKPNTNPVASLQGKVAGLQIVNSGQPGQEPDIRIRGTVSLFRTKPLYVIDGIFNDNMSYINPNDIESMEILKDPSSLAIFGVKGANGVIIVTTKKGKAGATTVNFNTSLGIKSITGKPSMTNGEQFRTLYAQQRENEGLAPYGSFDLFQGNTDWIDAISENSPIIAIHNLSISNATEKNRIYLSLGFTEEEGLIQYEKLKKFTFSINDELTLNNTFKVGVGLNGYDARMPQLHSFNAALNATPIVDAFNNEQGVYNQLPIEIGGAQIGNPLADVVEKRDTQLNRDTRFVANAFAEVSIIEGLKLRGAYLADFGFSRGRGYTPVFDVYVAESDELTPYSGNNVTSVTQFKSDFQRLQQELTLNYQKSFGVHNFNILGGYTRTENTFSSLNGSVRANTNIGQIPNNPRFWYIDVDPYGDQATRVSNSDEWDDATVSYLGRVLYNFDGKYLINGSFRRDGSSNVNRWQNFWAVGAAWEISKESFMQGSVFNFLKLKGSVGELGNEATSIRYPTYPGYVSGSGGAAVFGPYGEENLASVLSKAYRNNPNLKWETIASQEVGIEFGVLDNKLTFEANYYQKNTRDLLAFVNTEEEEFYTNAGEISNSGLELMASYNNNIGDFTYSISGNLTTMKNEVVSVFTDGYEIIDSPSRTSAGNPIGYFYGYKVEGVYQSYADILDSPPSSLGSYDVGDLKFKDVNGDGVVNEDDRTNIGSPTPDYTYGFSLNMGYKNFSLSMDFQGVYGNEVYRDWGNGSTFAPFNYRTARLDAWNGAGTSNWEPRLNDASGYNTNNRSDYMIEDGSYLRLRNVQLAYSFDTQFLNSLSIQNLRVYINAQNPITWKNNSGFSPEAGGSPTRFGVDSGGYPIPSITSFGINATF